jgi:hypothetical protein
VEVIGDLTRWLSAALFEPFARSAGTWGIDGGFLAHSSFLFFGASIAYSELHGSMRGKIDTENAAGACNHEAQLCNRTIYRALALPSGDWALLDSQSKVLTMAPFFRTPVMAFSCSFINWV